MSEMEEIKPGVTWRHLVACALATGVSTILAMYAVILAPVGAFPGVSGLYLAAAIYVPLSLWLGLWGCIAGYFSCLILGFVMTPYGIWSFIWALADFIEGLVPLLAFRIFKEDVDIGEGLEAKKKNILYLLLGVLIVNLIVAALATALVLITLWIITVIIAIALMFIMYLVNRSRRWLLFVIFGIIGASLSSALIGVGVPIIAGFVPVESFWIGFIGWFAGDLIVLSAIATPMMVTLTGKIKKTSIFVERWWS
jgi:hypothetical protein